MFDIFSFVKNFKKPIFLKFLFLFICVDSYAVVYHIGLNSSEPIKTDSVRCLYHGMSFNFAHQHCVFHDDAVSSYPAFFVLIITPTIEFDGDKAFRCPLLKSDTPCLWFNMTLVDANTWKIEKLEAKNMPKRIPDNAVVVLMSPELVESVGPDALRGKKIVHFPFITLKDDVTQDVLDCALNQCALSNPDINRFCSRACKAQTVCNNTLMCAYKK